MRGQREVSRRYGEVTARHGEIRRGHGGALRLRWVRRVLDEKDADLGVDEGKHDALERLERCATLRLLTIHALEQAAHLGQV